MDGNVKIGLIIDYITVIRILNYTLFFMEYFSYLMNFFTDRVRDPGPLPLVDNVFKYNVVPLMEKEIAITGKQNFDLLLKYFS